MNDRLGSFIITKSHEINEINAKLTELVHEKTGCEVIHLATDDDENIFNISFRTFPLNSNGAAHVLEHIVLCGSKKYPVKDPFFSMNRRSMNTFMNALTGADFTCYPAASQIPQDFYNLFDVYLDSVFHPRLLEESFWQEGIHFEWANSSLQLKGIVYNEMKGAMAQPESRLHEEIFSKLFPNLPYRFNSGGNPNEILNLTYEEVKAFHQQYYHPSRALFYFYGNLPLEKHLAFLEEKALKGVEKLSPLPQLPRQKRFQERVYTTSYYPSPDKEKKNKTYVAFSFLTTSILEQEELLALSVIDLALMGTDAAPLKRALLESELCKQVDSGFDDEISEVPYTITCKGCSEDKSSEIETILRKALADLVEKGIPKHLIEGALHQVEFSREEIVSSGSYPYGLSLFFRSGLLKQHGGDPSDGLKVHTLFKKLRSQFARPDYVAHLIDKHFLNNPHFVRLTLHPDPLLSEKEAKQEEDYRQRIQKSLSEQDIQKIQANQTRLLVYQEEEGDLELLPRLALSEVPKQSKDFPLKQEKLESLSLFHHSCFTNEILYGSLFFNFPALSEEDLVFFRLFTLLVPELGCGGRDYRRHLDFVFQYTGGIDFDLDLFVSAKDPSSMRPTLSFQGKTLGRNCDKLFLIFKDMLTSVDFSDTKRIEELLKQHLEGIENSIQRSPLRFALNLATSHFSSPLYLNYLWQGLDYCFKVKEVIKDFSQDPLTFRKKMEKFQEMVLGPQVGDLVICTNQSLYNELKASNFFSLANMKEGSFSQWKKEEKPLSPLPSQGRIIANPVAFTVLALPTVPYTHPLMPALSVASEIMENKTLHKKIREQGGAYGAGATNMASWGYFYFYAYRDPHIKSTLDSFQEAVVELLAGHFDERDIEEAILGVLQSLDAPIAPESRALVAYTWLQSGRTKLLRQTFRDQLMSLSKKEIKQVAEEILLPGITSKHVITTFAGQDLLTKENLLLKDKSLPIFSI